MKPGDEAKIRFVVNSMESMYSELGIVKSMEFKKDDGRDYIKFSRASDKRIVEIDVVDIKPEFIACEIAMQIGGDDNAFYYSREYKKPDTRE